MARIRTLKPEHKQHRKVGPLPHMLYRLWIGLITEADDHGKLVAEPLELRAKIFPYHPKETAERVQAALERLHELGLVRLYMVAGVQYLRLPSWADHQKISHPARSVLPNPLESSGILQNPLSGSDRTVPEGIVPEGPDRKTPEDAVEVSTAQEARLRVARLVARATKTP